jgi:hypothetical protein
MMGRSVVQRAGVDGWYQWRSRSHGGSMVEASRHRILGHKDVADCGSGTHIGSAQRSRSPIGQSHEGPRQPRRDT